MDKKYPLIFIEYDRMLQITSCPIYQSIVSNATQWRRGWYLIRSQLFKPNYKISVFLLFSSFKKH